MLSVKMIENHKHTHAQNRFAVIPTAEKLNADLRFAGKGVTIAFLDSGFYPHPDFVGRVLEFYDVAGEESLLDGMMAPRGHHWHGTQTVVSCAGDGALSDGIYKGLAHEAELVLIKVSEKGRISDSSIAKGLKWVLDNHAEYNIRIVNLSLGGDEDISSKDSKINLLAEELIKKGIVISVAAGNAGDTHSIPPANSPLAITVGGYSDGNSFESGAFGLYHSNFGETIDGIVKPEVIAPAMYVAAPILPDTEDYYAAEALSIIANAPDYSFRKVFLENWRAAGLAEYILSTDIATARGIVGNELERRKIIATHYQHVDGTSFAAPITASVIAQMLEANPRLTPAMVKNILISTASRIAGHSTIRQGFGVISTRLAVEAALNETHFFDHEVLTPPRFNGGKVVFIYHDDNAKSVHLACDLNGWDASKTPLANDYDGVWRAEVAVPEAGKYRYKFVIDNSRWIEDPSNGMKEEDGYGGFNSLLNVM